MFWQDTESDTKPPSESDKLVDVGFRINCPQLPVDHVQSLSDAIQTLLPWLPTETGAGIHAIHGAASGNGWQRPSDVLHLSRRAHLDIRAPLHRQDEVLAIAGQVLDVAGNRLELGKANVKRLLVSSTLFARHIRVKANETDEATFVDTLVTEIKALGIKLKKLLCGRGYRFTSAQGMVETRSVMVADLDAQDSIFLQEHGLRDDLLLGFGLFIPHKGIAAVKSSVS